MKPQDELSLVSPGSFIYNSRDFHVQRTGQACPVAKCSLTQTQQLTPTWKEQRSHYNSILRGRSHLSCLSPACLIYHKIIFSWAKTLSALTVQARDQGPRRNIRKGVFQGSWLWHLLQQPEKGEKKGELQLCSLFMIQIQELVC